MTETTTEIIFEPLQVWELINKDGEPIRRIKLLAKHPTKTEADMPCWIYEEMSGGKFRTEIGRLGIFPEYNIRYLHFQYGMVRLAKS